MSGSFWIPRNLKPTAKERLSEVGNYIAGYEGGCLFVVNDTGSYCKEPVRNRCHIVSRTKVLEGLRDKGEEQVLELQWGVGQWQHLFLRSSAEHPIRPYDSGTFYPPAKSPRETCSGRFACKQHGHDDEFAPIDVADPDFCNPVVRFLAAYRLALFKADQYRLATRLRSQLNRATRRILQRTVPEVTKGLEKGLENAEMQVALLGQHWHARQTAGTFDPSLVSAEVFSFRSKLHLAGGVFYGKASAVTVFPFQDDWHKMGLVYLTSEAGLAGEDLERLEEVSRVSLESGDCGVMVTEELMANGWGAVAVAPMSFERLNTREASTIRSLLVRTQEARLLKAIERHPYSGKRRWR